ncbi:MAG: hypothetical protein ACOYYS_17560 [Chloroflexota bacterium]
MNKIHRELSITALVCTLALAIPFTLAALIGAACLTEYAPEITALVQTINRQTSVTGRGWATELAARLPELAGMLLGMAVLLTILLLRGKHINRMGN